MTSVVGQRIRPTIGQWAQWVAWLAFIGSGVWSTFGGSWELFAVLVVGLAAARGIVMYRWGVTVGKKSLVVHGFRGHRAIDWSSILNIAAESRRGHTTITVIEKTTGRRTELTAPSTGLLHWDPWFQRKYQRVLDGLAEARKTDAPNGVI